jgi:hypothetical protein
MMLRELTRWTLGVVLTLSFAWLAWSMFQNTIVLMSYEVRSKPADCAPVVTDVMSGRLRPDRCGTVALPRRYSSLTKTGDAIVEEKKNGQVLIFFPTRGVGRAGSRGYLYHSRPLSKADILLRSQGFWEVGIAVCFGLHYQKSHLPLVPDRKVSPHWYYVRTPGAPHGG